jgi:tRNA dimethylallyltransferase
MEAVYGMKASGEPKEKPRLIVLTGPTGTGKTDLVLRLAGVFGGEVVSADSMQVYRYLDIGTAKPSRFLRSSLPHHLVDVADPDQPFHAALFVELAEKVIGRLHREGKTIWVVGGTGLYIRALLGGLAEAGTDPAIRKGLKRELAGSGLSVLHERLAKADPASAARIHRNDAVRILRALEVFEATGRTMTEVQREHRFRRRPYRSLCLGLVREREDLFSRIDRRAEEMFREGLVGEVENLVRRGYDETLKPLQTLTYRPVFRHLRGELTEREAVLAVKRDTRLYARRQGTWMKKEKDLEWFPPEDEDRLKFRIDAFLNDGRSGAGCSQDGNFLD